MSSNDHNDDEMEQRLRAYYRRHDDQPPATAQIWRSVAARDASGEDAIERGSLMDSSSPSEIEAKTTAITPDRRSRARSFATAGASIAAVVIIALIAQFVFAHRPHSGPVTPAVAPTATTNPLYVPGEPGMLTSVSFDSPADGWAVGEHSTGAEAEFTSVLFYHYTSGKWMKVTVPNSIQGNSPGLPGVAMLSPTDGYATACGSTLTSVDPVLWHYDGAQWSRVAWPASFKTGQCPTLIAAASATSVEIISTNLRFTDLAQAFLFDGTNWSEQAFPRHLNGIATLQLIMTSPTEGWMAASDFSNASYPYNALIMHLVNGAWTVTASFPASQINSIGLTTPGNGFAVGFSFEQGLFFQEQNGTWAQATPPFPPSRETALIAMRSPDDGWLFTRTGHAIYHYDGTSWTLTQFTFGISIEAVTFAGNDGWAVGVAYFSTPAILHETNGTWAPVPLG